MDNTGDVLALCPLCEKEKKKEKKEKLLYGVPVCRSCYYNLANLRQLAFFVDYLLWRGISHGIAVGIFAALAAVGTTRSILVSLAQVIGYILLPLFCLKDGFGGYSPGKALLGLCVVDQSTGAPATFLASFKRNLILIIPIVPLLVAFRLCKGSRWGDGWANTKVLWKKHKDKAPFLIGNPS